MKIHYIKPDKTTQKFYIRQFIGNYRKETLAAYLFLNLAKVRDINKCG
ncbi:hypothetical protein HZQ16_16295 [Elizabethkingia anophelis]|nr:hypothetical protein [Elizabethkingia anophelis]